MHVRLLGTGAADGWPNPWCSCASCSDVRARGETRRQTSVLVDGAVLLDLSPALPPDGVSLACVRTVLVTHAHPDHCAPAALLWRHWALPDERLTLAGSTRQPARQPARHLSPRLGPMSHRAHHHPMSAVVHYPGSRE